MSGSRLTRARAAGVLPLAAAGLLAVLCTSVAGAVVAPRGTGATPATTPTPAAAAAGAGTSPGTGATPGTSPTLSATVEQCVAAANQSGRSVTFAGQMETVAGARELAIQVVVQERAPEAESFHTLTSGGLGAWQHSEPGVSIYKVRQNVTDLPAPAAYRAIVRYRWLDERGNVIRREARRTPICREPVARHRP